VSVLISQHDLKQIWSLKFAHKKPQAADLNEKKPNPLGLSCVFFI
jgi:hypothetical protein